MRTEWLTRMFVVLAIAMACTVTAQSQQWRLLLPETIFNFQVSPRNPNLIYLSSGHNVLYRTMDGGKSWSRMVIGNQFSGNSLTSLHISSVDTSILLGGFQAQGMRKSTDGGTTWRTVLTDSNGLRMWFISDAIIEEPGSPGIMWAAQGTFPSTIHRSVDNGETWDSVSSVSTDLATRICTITIRPDSTDVMYLGCIGGIMLRSSDAGKTWATVPVLNGEHKIKFGSEIPKIIFSKKNPMIGYAVVAIANPDGVVGDGGILKTLDGGSTWDRIALADTSLWAIEERINSNGSSELYAGGFRTTVLPTVIKGDSLIWKSTDDGLTWNRMYGTPWQITEDGDSVRSIWMMRHSPAYNRMFMATQVGFYILDDENTSVNLEILPTNSGISISTLEGSIVVADSDPQQGDQSWKIYSMSGELITQGSIELGKQEHHLVIGDLASGRYLLVWGSEQFFRTELFGIQR